jgi:hypothetical protein
MIRVHPGEMARTPDQAGICIHFDSIRHSANVTNGDFAQHIGDGSPAFIDDLRL